MLLQALRETKEVQMEAWDQSTLGDQVLPKIYSLAALAHTFSTSHQESGTRFQDGPKIHSGCHLHLTVC